jgi:predicted RNA-binding protein with RPS1 domain
MMPPLDEIEVPGGGDDSGDRGGRGGRGGGRDGGRGGRGGGRDRGERDYSSVLGELRPGQVVTGTVVHIDHEGVLVDVGTKSEGLIRPNEMSREPIPDINAFIKVGDKIDVLVMEPEGRDGNLLLSKKRADFEKSWDKVQEVLASGETIQAMVSDRVKGGLVVDLGIRGFVPASHVGNGKLKNLEKFLGQSIPLKVLEVDREHRKVVLSHRLATEEEREREKQQTIGSLAEGQTRTGTVRRVTDYGAFVDLGGIDGLLHVSEMSWTRIKHPSDVVKVGQEIPVMILKLNLEQGRVSLGMRQILPDPWENVGEKYHVNDVVEGEVTRLVPFGAFVLLEGGIEGIIPNSELAHRRIAKPGDVVDAGQQVQVKVIDVRLEERRLTLSLRAPQARDAAPMVGSGAGPSAPTGDETGSRRGKDRRRGRGGDDDDYVGGGDWRQYSSAGGGGMSSGVTIGDMFGQMFADAGGGKGKAKAGGKRRRVEDEDEDFDPNAFEDDFDPNAEPEAVDAEADATETDEEA